MASFISLIEETESHVVIGFLIAVVFLLFLRRLLSSSRSIGSRSGATGSRSSGNGAAGGDGTELGATGLDHLLDCFAIKSLDDLVDSACIAVNAACFQDLLNGGRRGRSTTERSQKVRCQITHSDEF